MSNPGICEDTSPRQMTLSAKISHFKASLVVILVFEVKELQSRYQLELRDLIPLGILAKTHSKDASLPVTERQNYFKTSQYRHHSGSTQIPPSQSRL